MTFPEKFEEYQKLPSLNKIVSNTDTKSPQLSDASVTILSSSNVPKYRFKFYNVFPTSLSTFIMNTQDGPDNILTAGVTFRYTYSDIETIAWHSLFDLINSCIGGFLFYEQTWWTIRRMA